jgi:hypothetical protein
MTNILELSSTYAYGATQADATADSKTLFVANGKLGVAVYDLSSKILHSMEIIKSACFLKKKRILFKF